jgi:hypothetical protein
VKHKVPPRDGILGVVMGSTIYPIDEHQGIGEAGALVVALVEQLATRGLVSREMANAMVAATRK